MEDRAIIALYWARDEQAIARSQDKYGLFCRGLAMRILDCLQDAEECVNDTWHRAWDTIPPQMPESLRSYLGRIVRNLAIDRWRAGRAQRRGGADQILSELSDAVPDPRSGPEIGGDGLSEALDGWLRSLRAEDRRLFLRRYWYGYNVGELAAESGVPAPRLSRKLYRLRGSLKQWLEKEEIAL